MQTSEISNMSVSTEEDKNKNNINQNPEEIENGMQDSLKQKPARTYKRPKENDNKNDFIYQRRQLNPMTFLSLQ